MQTRMVSYDEALNGKVRRLRIWRQLHMKYLNPEKTLAVVQNPVSLMPAISPYRERGFF